MVAVQIVSLLLVNVAAFFGLVFGGGWIRALAGISVVIALCFHLGGDAVMRVSPLYCLTLPLGATMFAYILLRSTVITLRQGGIYWRGAFFSIVRVCTGVGL